MGEPAKKLDPQPAAKNTAQATTKVGNVIYGAFGNQSLPPKKAPAPHVKQIIEPRDLARLLADLNIGSTLAGSKIYGSFLDEPASNSDIYEIRYDQPSEDFFLNEEDTARFLWTIRHHLRTARAGEYYKKITAFQKEINKALVEAGILKEDLNLSEFLESGISRNNDFTGREKLPHELKTTVEVLAVLVDFVDKIPVIEKPKAASNISILTFEQLNRKPVDAWPRIKKEVVEPLTSRSVRDDSFLIFTSEGPYAMPPIRDGLNNWLQAVFSIPGYATQLSSLNVHDLFLPTDVVIAPEQLNSIDLSRLKLILEKLDPILTSILDGKETPTASTQPEAVDDSPVGGEPDTQVEEEELEKPQPVTETLNLEQATQLVLDNQEFVETLGTGLFKDTFAGFFTELTETELDLIRPGRLAWKPLSEALVKQPVIIELITAFLKQTTFVNEDRVTQQLVVNNEISTKRLRELLVANRNTDRFVTQRFIEFAVSTNQIGQLIATYIATLRQIGQLPTPTPTAATGEEPATAETPSESPRPQARPTQPVSSLEEIVERYRQSQNIPTEAAYTSFFEEWSKKKIRDKIAYLIEIGALPDETAQRRMGATIDFLITESLGLDPTTLDPSFYQSAAINELRNAYWASLDDIDPQFFLDIINNRADLKSYNQQLLLKFPKLNKFILQASYKLNLTQQQTELAEIQKVLKGDTPFSTTEALNFENATTALQIYLKNPDVFVDSLTITELLKELGLEAHLATYNKLSPAEQQAFAASLKEHLIAYLLSKKYAKWLSSEFKKQIEIGLITAEEYLADKENNQTAHHQVLQFVKETNVSKSSIPQPVLIVFAPYGDPPADGDEIEDENTGKRISSLSKEAKEIQEKLVRDYWLAALAANQMAIEAQFAEDIANNPDFLRTPPPNFDMATLAQMANQGKKGTKGGSHFAIAKSLAGMATDQAIGTVVPGGNVASRLLREYGEGMRDAFRGRINARSGAAVGVTAGLLTAGTLAAKFFADSLYAAATNWGAFMGGSAGATLLAPLGPAASAFGFTAGAKLGDALLPNFELFGMKGPLDFGNLQLGNFGEIFNSFLANLSNFGGSGIGAIGFAAPATALFTGLVSSLLAGSTLLAAFTYNVPTSSQLRLGSGSGSVGEPYNGPVCWPTWGLMVQAPYGNTYCTNYQQKRISWSHCNGGLDHSSYWPDAYDVVGSLGRPVVAMQDGVVTLAFNSIDRSFGKHVVVAGENSIMYAHLSKVSVQIGQPVSVGDELGLMGKTGTDGDVHLHFEIVRGTRGSVLQKGDADAVSILRNLFSGPKDNSQITQNQMCKKATK